MAANIVCAPVPWAWTYPGWPPPLDLLGTCGWGSPAHQSTHSHKTTWRPFLFNQPCPMISYYLTIISKRKYLTNTFHFLFFGFLSESVKAPESDISLVDVLRKSLPLHDFSVTVVILSETRFLTTLTIQNRSHLLRRSATELNREP